MVSRQDVETLKAKWLADPCWDVYTTEGFEEYKQELKKFQKQQEEKWQKEKEKNLYKIKNSLNISPEMANYIIALEERLNKLEKALRGKQ